MSEAIYQEVERCIRDKLHVGIGPCKPLNSMHYRYPVDIERGNIIMRDSDCGLAKPTMEWTTDRWSEEVAAWGLCKMVGMWDFVPADDPAADIISLAHRNPTWAGQEIYRLRQQVSV